MSCFVYWFERMGAWEGGYVNHPNDRGGPTNKGVTWDSFKYYANKFDWPATDARHRALTKADVELIARDYWRRAGCEGINSCAVAIWAADMFWGGGVNQTVLIQRILNRRYGYSLKEDGVIGPLSQEAINSVPDVELVGLLAEERRDFHRRDVAANPEQAVFLNGWINRVNDFEQFTLQYAQDNGAAANDGAAPGKKTKFGRG